MEPILFLFLALVTVVAAVVLISCRQPLHGALALVVVAVGLAGLCALLGAPVLAAAALLLTGGVGLLCAVLSLSLRIEQIDIAHRDIAHRDIAFWLAIFFALILGVQLLLHSEVAGDLEGSATIASAGDIASALFADFLLPLHVVALVLLCAMVGTLLLTRSEKRP